MSDYISLIKIIAVIVSIALSVYTLIQWLHRKRPNRDVVQCRTGTVGAGKTFLSVHDLMTTYKKYNKAYKRRNNVFFLLLGKTSKVPPVVYSNIPLYLGKEVVTITNEKGRKKKVKVEVWSNVLKREHFLLQEMFPANTIPLVLWDEIGLSANQYSHDDPNITSDNVIDNYQCVEVFIRFFRHFYGETSGDKCRLWTTDQASGDVCIALRRRFGMVDNLNDFRRFFGFLPFFKVDVRTMMMSDDTVQNVNKLDKDKDERAEYYMGFLPYKKLSKRHYDSHAYSGAIYTGFTKRLPFDNWSDNNYIYHDENGRIFDNKLKTNYCPDLRMTREELAEYKARIALVQKIAKDKIFAENK